MQTATAERPLEVDFDSLKLSLDLAKSSPPPLHTSLPSESTDSTASSSCSSPTTTPETTPDGSVIADSTTPITSTSTTTLTTSSSTTTNIPIPPVPSDSALAIPHPVPRRHKSTGILMTSSTARVRSTSLPGSSTSLPSDALSLKIKFAPLPELAPRRRKSNVPLGVAARGQLMRRRRAMMYGSEGENGSPMWTDQETEAHLRRQLEAQERRRMSLLRAMQEEERARMREEDEVEDPFVALGRMMKGAWRKMSGKDKDKPKVATNTPSDTPSAAESQQDSKEPTTTGELDADDGSGGESGNITGMESESGTQIEREDEPRKEKEDWQTQTIVP